MRGLNSIVAAIMFASAGVCSLLIAPISAAAAPAQDLVGKTYQVETTEAGAVNVAIDFNRVGYGVISPSRVIPEGGGLPAYRIETLADSRGNSVILIARIRAKLTSTVDEWLVTSALAAPKVSSDSNLTFECPGNSDAAPVVQFVYYDGGRRGAVVKKIAAGFALDRRSGALTEVVKPSQGCRATEDPL